MRSLTGYITQPGRGLLQLCWVEDPTHPSGSHGVVFDAKKLELIPHDGPHTTYFVRTYNDGSKALVVFDLTHPSIEYQIYEVTLIK